MITLYVWDSTLPHDYPDVIAKIKAIGLVSAQNAMLKGLTYLERCRAQ